MYKLRTENLLSVEVTGRPATVQVNVAWQGGEAGRGRRAQKVAGPRSRANTGLGHLVKQISGSWSFFFGPSSHASIAKININVLLCLI